MQFSRRHVLSLAGTALAANAQTARAAQTAPASSRRDLKKADIDRMMKTLSNWGRWGARDQLGALNLITPAKRKEAAALVRDGVSVSLARDAELVKAVDNDSPFVHEMTATGQKPARRTVLPRHLLGLLPRLCALPHGCALPYVL